jgi:hypothetical protein
MTGHIQAVSTEPTTKGIDMTIPRRIRIDLMTPEERACRDAIMAIEKMPHAHPLLTEAQSLIALAQARLADFIDRDDPSQRQFVGYPRFAGEGKVP